MLLYIIRHGIPDYETDTLTREGIEQAEALSNRLLQCGINKIFSSPLGRARETAIPTSIKLGIKIQILQFASEDIYWKSLVVQDPKTQELEWGYKDRSNYLGRIDSYTNGDFSGGFYYDNLAKGSLSFLKKESDTFISSLGYVKNGIGNGYDVINDNDEKVAIFCHQGFGLHWISYLLNIPFHIFTASFDITHTGITIIRFTPEHNSNIAFPLCLCFSDTSHIYSNNLPMKYNEYIDF